MASRESRLRAGVGDRRDPTAQLHVLTLTTLFPSVANPRHGIFVETRLRKLCEHSPVTVDVVAPVPWFPSRWSGFGRYATYAATPRVESRFGMRVHHPRYVMIPKIGMAIQPRSLASAAMRAIDSMMRSGAEFDVVDAHYFYPDGVAASLVARWLRKPLVITARGSDVNLIGRLPGPRRAMLRASEQAHRVIAVSAALKRALVGIGAAEAKIEVLRNGVDLETFQFRNRDVARSRLGVETGPLILSVGNLVPEKGHDLVMEAAAKIAGAHVAVVGRGPELRRLVELGSRLGIAGRTRFLDNVAQPDLAELYSAADALVLGSQREGWPNVLLESMACGTPAVATDVGGVREIVGEAPVGEIVKRRAPDSFASAIERVLAAPVDRGRLRAYAGRFDWESIVRRYFQILRVSTHSKVEAQASQERRE